MRQWASRAARARVTHMLSLSQGAIRDTYDPRCERVGGRICGFETTRNNTGLQQCQEQIGRRCRPALMIASRQIRWRGFAVIRRRHQLRVANSGPAAPTWSSRRLRPSPPKWTLPIFAALAYGWQEVTTISIVNIAGSICSARPSNATIFRPRRGGDRFVAPWIGASASRLTSPVQFTTIELPA